MTAVYNPKAFIPHAASLRQTFVHCGRFSTAATRRCPDSVSVPVVGAALSRPLVVFGTVGRYPAVYLVTRRPLRGRNRTLCLTASTQQDRPGLPGVSPRYTGPSGRSPTPYYPVRR